MPPSSISSLMKNFAIELFNGSKEQYYNWRQHVQAIVDADDRKALEEDCYRDPTATPTNGRSFGLWERVLRRDAAMWQRVRETSVLVQGQPGYNQARVKKAKQDLIDWEEDDRKLALIIQSFLDATVRHQVLH